MGKLAASGGSVYAADRVDDADSLVKLDDSAVEIGRTALAGHVVDGPWAVEAGVLVLLDSCLLYTSPSPRDLSTSRMPSSA